MANPSEDYSTHTLTSVIRVSVQASLLSEKMIY